MKTRIIFLLAVAASAGLAGAEEPELIRIDGKWVKLPPPKEGTAEGELAIVRRDVDKKHYSKAVKHAKRFLKRYPADPLAEEVLSLAGDAQMQRGRYWDAYKLYERQLNRYPTGLLAERSMGREVEIAQAWLGGKKRRLLKIFWISAKQDGLEVLEKISERAVATERGQTALLIIANYHFDNEEWMAAAEYYDTFLKMYAKSDRAAHAELRAAEAYRRSYRGPSWDETPLIEAEQRYKAFAQRHPARARQAQVEQIIQEIREDRAAKQYEVAQFYLRTDKPDAALHYLNIIVTEYPNTRLVGQAQVVMTQLQAGSQTPASPAPREDTTP